MPYTKGNFEQNLKKGQIGEKIVREEYESRGWIVYLPLTKDKPHVIDMMITWEKSRAFATDIKTKDRYRYHKWNGVNKKCYNEYLNFNKEFPVPFYLTFVDKLEGAIYRINIKKTLEIKPTYETWEMIAWNIDEMEHIRHLTKKEVAAIDEVDNEKQYIQQSLFIADTTYVGQSLSK